MAIADVEIQSNIQPGMKITEDELMRLPKDGRRWELVEGRLKEVPTNWRHDEIGGIIVALLMAHSRGLGSITTGQAGFRMKNRNIRVPDVSFTRRERIPGGGPAPETFGDAAPDLCVEIISPSESPEDIAGKMREYFTSGAEQVWHVFPETQQVIVFTSPTEAQTFNGDDILNAGEMLPGFSYRVAEFFSWE